MIRKMQGAKFLMDNRMWVVGLPHYDPLLEELKRVCENNQIHIEEIPTFIMNLVLHKIPFTGTEIQMGTFNYSNDDFVRLLFLLLTFCRPRYLLLGCLCVSTLI